MVIQAVDAEVHRLRNLPDDQSMPEDEVRLGDFENLAEELEEMYEMACAEEPTLPAYQRLLRQAV